ncbi:MAG: T9SS type A sorting domain-containing protein [Crocinitomicaceae bacterium]|nr:T9SS type A sorting domain-containing protein [Crocinitomicaceae bacterium]
MSRLLLLAVSLFFLNTTLSQINIQWETRFEHPANFIDKAVDLELDASGNTYVTGSSFNGSNYDWVTIKYDPNGNELWNMTYGGSGLDEASALAMDSNGDIVVTGTRFVSGSDWDIAVVKYNGSTGAEMWSQIYSGSSNFDQSFDVTTDGLNNVIITGSYYFSGTDIDWIVVEYNSSGTFQWFQGGGTSNSDAGKVVATDASNNIYMAGHSQFSSGTTYFDFRVVKLSAAGAVLNNSTQDAGFNGLDTPHAMKLDASGNIFVGGQGFNAPLEEEDYVLMKFNNSCVHQWTRTYSGDAEALDRINAIDVDQLSGNVFVTGRSKSLASSEDYYTIAYNTSGTELWNHRYTSSGAGFDEATDIQLSGTGFVYLTGYTYNSGSNNDYTTVKYDVSGNLIWDTKFDGPSGLSDQAVKMQLDASENIFVTGASHGGVTNLDYSTIKYCQLTTVASPDTALCLGQNVSLTASGGFNITWAVLSGDMSSLSCTSCATTVATPNTTSVYIVSSESASGCIDYDTVTVTINPIPTPTIYNDTPLSFCTGDSVTLYTDSYSTYSWSTSSTDSFTTVYSTGTYTVTITDVNGCQNSANASVTAFSLPTVDAGTNFSVCPGTSGTLNASGASTYLWTFNSTLTPLNVSNPTATPTAVTKYYVTGTDGNGCKNKDSVTVSLYTPPVVNAGVDGQVCVGDSILLGASGAVSYVWNTSPYLSALNVSNPYAFPVAQTTFTVTGTDANGCTDQDQVIISTLSLPGVDAGPTNSHCLGDSSQIFATGALTWQWQADPTISNTTISNPWVDPVVNTWYYVSGTDVNGCTKTDSVLITVDALPNVSAGANVSICLGDSANLTASGASTYQWDSHPTFLSPTNISNPWVKPVVPTTYTVTGTNTTTGCENTAQVTIGINPLPSIDAGADTSMCLGDTLQLMATGGVTYIWTNDATLSNNLIADPLSTTMVNKTYYIDGWDVNGCHGEDSIHITINPNPSAPVITLDGQWLISNQTSGNQWYFEGAAVTGETNDSLDWVAQNQNGYYTLLYTDQNGCSTFSLVNNIIEITTAGIEEDEAFVVNLYPNPTQGILNLELGTSIDLLLVVTMNGQVVQTQRQLTEGIQTLDLSDLPGGVYMIQLVKEDKIVNKRIVKH